MLKAETKDGFHRLVHEAVVKAGYQLRGLIIDAAPGWVEAWDDYFARVPLQLCRIHFDRRLDQDIPKVKRSSKAPLHAELKDRISAVLYADTLDDALGLRFTDSRAEEHNGHSPLELGLGDHGIDWLDFLLDS